MSETKNYKLYLEGNVKSKFKVWRERMNGEQDSNMTKIDAVLGEKANSSVAVTATLLASKWSGVEAPYTQTIAVEGLSANQNGSISVAQNATPDQRDIARCAMLSVIGQNENSLTIAADGDMPEFDIPVVVVLLG